MLRTIEVVARDAAKGDASAADVVLLDYDRRHRRRLVMDTRSGVSFLLDRAEATPLRGGDRLILEDGRMVLVEAADEPLTAITAASTTGLMRIAWHLGNRHLPTQLTADRLLIRRDHVIEAMIEGLGGACAHVDAPFDPEGGAYAQGHAHAANGDAHGHAHRPHDHAAPSAAAPSVDD